MAPGPAWTGAENHNEIKYNTKTQEKSNISVGLKIPYMKRSSLLCGLLSTDCNVNLSLSTPWMYIGGVWI